jgi:adenylate cyclase
VSIAVLTLAVTGLAAIGLNADVFAGFQRRATDSLFPAAPDDGNIAVVGFDTKTIDPESGLGYPLPREKVAVLIDNLKAAGAKVIAFDVIYRSPSTTPGADAAMRDAIDRAGNVVLAEEPTIGPARDGVYTTTDLSPIAPEIAQTTGATPGQVHLNKDPSDGVSRSAPLVVSTPKNDGFVPALSLAAVMMYRGLSPSQFIVRPHGVQVGDRFVPTDDAKSMLLNF